LARALVVRAALPGGLTGVADRVGGARRGDVIGRVALDVGANDGVGELDLVRTRSSIFSSSARIEAASLAVRSSPTALARRSIAV
jgi:hypothetical protein